MARAVSRGTISNPNSYLPTRAVALGTLIALTVAACSSDRDAGPASVESSPMVTPAADETVVTSAPETTPDTVAATTSTVAGPSMADFQADVAALCDPGAAALAALPPNDGTIGTVSGNVTALRQSRDQSDGWQTLEAPADLAEQMTLLDDLDAAAGAALDAAEQAAGAGDIAAAEDNVTLHIDKLASGAALLAIIGATCGPADAERAANADLNVMVQNNGSQIGAGFGSIWVSEGDGDTVVRIDPDNGEILARIDVADGPGKMQPADGKIWVRARDEYVRIDPATNEVDATLAKADVGPAANRNWALDGTMWVCDGRQLHRYDPTTIERQTTIDLDSTCDYVYATPELVVVWTYNEDAGLAPDQAAAMIDPTTNEVLATIPLPTDVVFPAVLDDKVFFAGNQNPTAVVIDRATWTVTATPDLGRDTGGGGIVTDGQRIFVPTRDAVSDDVLVVDTGTYEVVDVIEPLDVNHLVLLDGSLWLTQGALDVVQRFDVGST